MRIYVTVRCKEAAYSNRLCMVVIRDMQLAPLSVSDCMLRGDRRSECVRLLRSSAVPLTMRGIENSERLWVTQGMDHDFRTLAEEISDLDGTTY